MIQANDLRVGNILQSYEGSEFEYVVIQSGDIKICQEANENFNNWRKPIPITEEWILRLGFENCINGWWSENELMNIKLYDDGIVIYLIGSDTNLANGRIHYINQLQNLYHALTGEELTIKL